MPLEQGGEREGGGEGGGQRERERERERGRERKKERKSERSEWCTHPQVVLTSGAKWSLLVEKIVQSRVDFDSLVEGFKFRIWGSGSGLEV